MANSLTSIRDACSRPGRYNLLGVVVDTLPIFATRGSSKCVTFTIKDSDLDGPPWAGGVKIKYFNDDESTLPDTRVNDVVFVRNIRVGMHAYMQDWHMLTPSSGFHVPGQPDRSCFPI